MNNTAGGGGGTYYNYYYNNSTNDNSSYNNNNNNNNNAYYYYTDGQHIIEELPDDTEGRHGDLLYGPVGGGAAPLNVVENEEEEEEGQRQQQQQQQPNKSRPFLHIDVPLSSTARELAAGRGPSDAVTAALLRQLQQEQLGQPRTPLSPQTLQRWASAAEAGLPFSPSPAEILEAVPLALTWHGMGPGEQGEVAGQKRSCRPAGDSAELPPAKRHHAEGDDDKRRAGLYPVGPLRWPGREQQVVEEDGGSGRGRKRARE